MQDWPKSEVVTGPLTAGTHSFIVKVWTEETAREAGRARWRGHITHVPGGQRHYIEDLDAVADFIAPYLEEMGVNLGRGWRARRRLNGWLRTFTG